MPINNSNNGSGKQKDWVLFPFDATNEKSIKLDFSGNINLDNGNKGTILGVKGSSRDGNTKFVKIFAQIGVLFRGEEKFTGEMNYPEAGGHKGLIGWVNESGNILSGYKNEPRPKQDAPKKETPIQPKAESKEILF